MLVCERCGLGQEIPQHCGVDMKPEPKTGPVRFFKCEGCGYELDLPEHHGRPMKLKA